MSKEALAKVIQRSISDAAFRRQLATDPTGALRGYDLSSDETSAIRTGDSRRLVALGVEQRMSKAFALGTDSTVSNTVSSDLGASWTGAMTSASGEASGALSPNDGVSSSGALTPNDSASASGALASGDSSDTDPMIASGNELGRTSVVAGSEPQHALNDDTDGYTPSFNYASTGDSGAQHDVLVSGDGDGGATPAVDHSADPNISQ